MPKPRRSPRAPRAATRDRGAPPPTPSPTDEATGEPGVTSSSGVGAAVPPGSKDAFPIAGIRASAGGLEPFSELLSHLPVEAPRGFELIQHLDPKHPRTLTGILS